MGILIGIDAGGSSVKTAALSGGKIICAQRVDGAFPLCGDFGPLRTFLDANGLRVSDVERICTTGVGSSFLTGDICGIPTDTVPEFAAVGRGGLWLAGVKKAVVVSIGTGTSFVLADGKSFIHLGGSGVGGGTFMGLGRKLTGAAGFDELCALAKMGHPANVDITVGDISNGSIGNLSADVTAANLSKPLENASAEDLAAGVLNMVLETVFALAVFAARGAGLVEGPVVLTGSLAKAEHIAVVREVFSRLHPTRFILPDSAEFAAATGAALTVCV